MEYNRCSIPRLSTRLGDREYKQYEKEMEAEKQKEEILEKKIREMRKARDKQRKGRIQKASSAPKRRKIEEGRYIEPCKTWNPENLELLEDMEPAAQAMKPEKRREE